MGGRDPRKHSQTGEEGTFLRKQIEEKKPKGSGGGEKNGQKHNGCLPEKMDPNNHSKVKKGKTRGPYRNRRPGEGKKKGNRDPNGRPLPSDLPSKDPRLRRKDPGSESPGEFPTVSGSNGKSRKKGFPEKIIMEGTERAKKPDKILIFQSNGTGRKKIETTHEEESARGKGGKQDIFWGRKRLFTARGKNMGEKGG